VGLSFTSTSGFDGDGGLLRGKGGGFLLSVIKKRMGGLLVSYFIFLGTLLFCIGSLRCSSSTFF
jgi:hypothetical protein